MLLALGVSVENIAFIGLSTITATIGGLVHSFNARVDFSKIPEDSFRPKSRDHAFDILAWVIARLTLAVATGLVLGMYLAPMAKSGDEVLRLLALVAVAGYSAPKLWMQQSKALEKLISRGTTSAQSPSSTDEYRA